MNKAIIKAIKKRVSQEQINRVHFLRALHAAIKYRFPARDMLVFGITGTKGKTTTCHMLASILEEAGYKVGLATTVSFQVGEDKWLNDTNKSVIAPMKLQSLLARMKSEHCDVAILEVTSIGLDQYRLWGIPFRYVGLTNIAHDHLDYHKNWDRYISAKLKLFQQRSNQTSVINIDDAAAEYFLANSKAKKKIGYSIESPTQHTLATDHVWADKIYSNMNGATFNMHTEDETVKVKLQLPGRFSVQNALCAAALASNLNLKLGTIAAGLEKLVSVPGRLERIETKKGFAVLIDYAHTPDSLEKLYSTMRPDVRGRMIAVMGSTGDRDRTKRPIMGALAARFCDIVLVTDEEPYTEDPMQIIEEVAKGVPRGRALYKPNQVVAQKQEKRIFKQDTQENGEGDWWWKIADRRAAIQQAIEMAKMDDMILVTGMGSQSYRIVGDQKESWNERAVVEEILAEKNLL